MKRLVIYIVVLALSLVVPEYAADVGKLIPVELVYIYKEEDQIVIETDAEVWGKGNTMDAAVQDMRDSAAGEIFLDTAQYLLIGEGAEGQIEAASQYLKGSVRVCLGQRDLDLQEAASYLDVHRPKMKLKVAGNQVITEYLKQIGGKLKIF